MLAARSPKRGFTNKPPRYNQTATLRNRSTFFAMARTRFFLYAALLSALALALIATSLPRADAKAGGATLKAAATW